MNPCFNSFGEAFSATARRLMLFTIVVTTLSSNGAYAQETILAIVNGSAITQSEVDDAIAPQLFPLQQQIHALRKQALDNLILRRLLEEEATKRRITVEELRRLLVGQAAHINSGQVERLYLENAQTFGSMSPDEAKERLRLDLEGQARMRRYVEALAKIRESATVEVRIPSSLPIEVRNLDSSMSLGERNARVTIVEFSDYQCSFCRSMDVTLKRVLKRYEGRIRFVLKHLPLVDTHPLAFQAAQAAFCAGKQRSFWEYHDALFAADQLLNESFEAIARRLDLDLGSFNLCRESDQSRLAILEDMKEARRFGIVGTPAFVINGKLTRGAMSVDDLTSIIEQELRTTKEIPPPP